METRLSNKIDKVLSDQRAKLDKIDKMLGDQGAKFDKKLGCHEWRLMKRVEIGHNLLRAYIRLDRLDDQRR